MEILKDKLQKIIRENNEMNTKNRDANILYKFIEKSLNDLDLITNYAKISTNEDSLCGYAIAGIAYRMSNNEDYCTFITDCLNKRGLMIKIIREERIFEKHTKFKYPLFKEFGELLLNNFYIEVTWIYDESQDYEIEGDLVANLNYRINLTKKKEEMKKESKEIFSYIEEKTISLVAEECKRRNSYFEKITFNCEDFNLVRKIYKLYNNEEKKNVFLEICKENKIQVNFSFLRTNTEIYGLKITVSWKETEE